MTATPTRRSDLVPAAMRHHLLLGLETHGVTRLLARDPTVAADVVESLARRVRLTVTLHDVPQPTDGPVFRARAAAYGRFVRASHAWATNSWHEHALVGRWRARGLTGR